MAARYVIPDEPRPSTLSHLAVDPFWPLFSQMLVGSWLALPWFALNGMAVGSPTRVREWVCLLASALGSPLLLLLIALAAGNDLLSKTGMQIAFLSIIALKISIAYALYVMQSRSFELWQYFGGKARNGLLLIVVGFFIRARLLTALADSPYLRAMLG